MQKYVNDIDRLNIYAKMTDHHLINIILNSITPCLRQAIAHYEDLHSDPSKWKEKLLHMDFITTKFQKKEQDNRSKGQGRKRGLDERIQFREGESRSEKKKGDRNDKDSRFLCTRLPSQHPPSSAKQSSFGLFWPPLSRDVS